MMQVRASVFKYLIELYPKTKDIIKRISLEKHEIINNYLTKHEKSKRLRLAIEIEKRQAGDVEVKNESSKSLNQYQISC